MLKLNHEQQDLIFPVSRPFKSTRVNFVPPHLVPDHLKSDPSLLTGDARRVWWQMPKPQYLKKKKKCLCCLYSSMCLYVSAKALSYEFKWKWWPVFLGYLPFVTQNSLRRRKGSIVQMSSLPKWLLESWLYSSPRNNSMLNGMEFFVLATKKIFRPEVGKRRWILIHLLKWMDSGGIWYLRIWNLKMS